MLNAARLPPRHSKMSFEQLKVRNKTGSASCRALKWRQEPEFSSFRCCKRRERVHTVAHGYHDPAKFLFWRHAVTMRGLHAPAPALWRLSPRPRECDDFSTCGSISRRAAGSIQNLANVLSQHWFHTACSRWSSTTLGCRFGDGYLILDDGIDQHQDRLTAEPAR